MSFPFVITNGSIISHWIVEQKLNISILYVIVEIVMKSKKKSGLFIQILPATSTASVWVIIIVRFVSSILKPSERH
jgi:hypothetical protein